MTIKKYRELCGTPEVFETLAEVAELRSEPDVLGLVLMSLRQLGYTKKETNRILARVRHNYEKHTTEQTNIYWRKYEE